MKKALVLSSLLFLSTSAYAEGLGAVLGGMLGYGVAKNYTSASGNLAAAAVAGSILGSNMQRNYNRPVYAESPYYGNYETQPRMYSERLSVQRCSQHVPYEYRNNPPIESAWINGCIEREMQRIAELEEQAYLEGLRGQ